MMVHLLFEQSGHFKNKFKELGYEAQDYDILNQFNETDNEIDLFAEIEKEFKNITNGTNEKTIFQNIAKEDLTIAFFPCVRFSEQHQLQCRCQNFGMKNWSEYKKLNYSQTKVQEIADFYKLFTTLIYIYITAKN